MTKVIDFFKQASQRDVSEPLAQASGVISRVVGLTLEAKGLNLALGMRCLVAPESGGNSCEVEVVGFDGDTTFLMPLKAIGSLKPGTPVVPARDGILLPVGEKLLGRVLNGIGQPIDGGGELAALSHVGLEPEVINPLHRVPIDMPLDVGIRSINSLLTIGCGQRIGLFAGSGVGKSVLLGMMTRFTEADVVVVALVGERGREVREFVEINLGEQGLKKSVVVASPADDTPVMRLRAGMYAARLSEHFRDQGKKTLLLFDSLTRFAQAQREVALAAGEPPATRGYPPSVFSLLPRLVERAGNGTGNGGSVTGIYTVLAEDEDVNDPVSDAARAILDGHIVLSRALAGEGIYPAVDIQASISRVMNSIVPAIQQQDANQLKQWVARFSDSRDLINVGAYTAGVDPVTDAAIEKQPKIQKFLIQALNESVSYKQSVEALTALVKRNDSVSHQGQTAAGGDPMVQADVAGFNAAEPSPAATAALTNIPQGAAVDVLSN